MNPGPAPAPPAGRAKVTLTPNVYNTPGNPNLKNIYNGPDASANTSQASLHRTGTSSGEMTVIKDGWAKVKEEGGGFMKSFWNERFLVLREKQLDFLKNNTHNKTTNVIYLKDVSHITRSDSYPYALEITRDGNKVWILKFEADTEVYNWMDSIYDRCPQMGGVSHPTGFSHRVHVGFDPVTGGFVGLPVEWERLLKGSALTKDDMAKNPQAVMEVLQFYTDKLQVRADDPKSYPSLTPTPSSENNANKQLGYNGGNGVTPPRPQPPGVNRQDSNYSGNGQTRAPGSYGSGSSREQSTDRRNDDDRARRQQEEQKEHQRRLDEEQERKRRQEQEDREYNESLPKTKTPLAKQEVGGGGYSDSSSRDVSPANGHGKYNASRPAPPAPSQSKNGQAGSSLPIRNLQAQRAAPSPPQNGASTPAKKPGATGAQSPYAVKQPGTGANGQARKDEQPLTAGAGHQKQASTSGQVKPLNVATKQPSGKPDPVKVAEAALTKKDPEPKKEVRMSAMSDAQVMDRLRSVVTLSNPLESYNKQKKIGQGASGSVYVARVRESAPSSTAQNLIKMYGPKAQVAIKQMDLRSQPRKELIVNEIIVMKESRHDNIVNFLDAFLQEETYELWVVMEFMEGGALTDVIDNNASISEDQIATICYEVSNAKCSIICMSQALTVNRHAKVSSTCTRRTLYTETSSQTTFFCPHAAPSRLRILASAPSSRNSDRSVLPWSARHIGWLPRSSSKRSMAPKSISGRLASWRLR